MREPPLRGREVLRRSAQTTTAGGACSSPPCCLWSRSRACDLLSGGNGFFDRSERAANPFGQFAHKRAPLDNEPARRFLDKIQLSPPGLRLLFRTALDAEPKDSQTGQHAVLRNHAQPSRRGRATRCSRPGCTAGIGSHPLPPCAVRPTFQSSNVLHFGSLVDQLLARNW